MAVPIHDDDPELPHRLAIPPVGDDDPLLPRPRQVEDPERRVPALVRDVGDMTAVARPARRRGVELAVGEGKHVPPVGGHEPQLIPLAAERSEEHTSELQSPCNLVCRLLLEKKKKNTIRTS